jgi:hypothetical protein
MKFVITEEEKSRILNMHKNTIKRQYLNEQDPTVVGNVYNAGREESLVKQGMYYIGFSVGGDKTQYYYQCIWDPNSFYDVTKIKGTAQEPGAVFNSGFKVIKNPETTLGLTGNWKEQFKNGCATSYSELQKFRDTHCPNQKDTVWKSPEHYKQQCEGWNKSKQVPDQVASAKVSSEELEADINRSIKYGFITMKKDPTTGKSTYISTGKGDFTIGNHNMNVPKGIDVTAEIDAQR